MPVIISIHALVKRATIERKMIVGANRNFNPRPRKEGDSALSASGYCHSNFNPRPRKEGDIVLIGGVIHHMHFNPRPRKEGDMGITIIKPVIINISIHALVKRATNGVCQTRQ